MTNEGLNKILSLPKQLKLYRVFKREEGSGAAKEFSVLDADRLIRYFDADEAANSVTYPAYLTVCGRERKGFITISRNGHLHMHERV